ncbi:conserved membrane protein, unknown function [Hepatocystis sp. ex Piliocolobus tephrosceles]|nr:conserved membrane protein, unknown function [Hepatocystis sp. ex Piliocolobus tephrosceles]
MDITTYYTFTIFILFIILSCWLFYRNFVKQKESTLLTAFTFILALSSSFILILFIPIDIYLTSNGKLDISILELKQKTITKFYHFMFWVLICQAYVLVPFSYFYIQNKSLYKNEFDDNISVCENVIESFGKMIYFIIFLVVLSIIGLIYRPYQKIAMTKGKELEYIVDLLDIKHAGESAILFLMGCVMLIGVSFWVTYTSHGLACLPLAFLHHENLEQCKKEIEDRFNRLKEKEMLIKSKYTPQNEIKQNDKNEIVKIEKMKKILSKYNYKLQEKEKIYESWLSYVLGLVFTFRIIIGIIFLTFSFTIYISLLSSIVDKFFNSICAYNCGFVLDQINTIFNLLDSLLMFFSKFFPMDLFAIASLAIYIFCCSLYGIINVGISVFFIPIFKIKRKNTPPKTLLVVCFVFIHIILVSMMTLLTIAPNYTTYGIQKIKINDNMGYMKCSLQTNKKGCRMSVLSVFFNKIFFGIPYLANSYFFSNWFFIIMCTFSFVYHLFFKKISYFDKIDNFDFSNQNFEEETNLLQLETLT